MKAILTLIALACVVAGSAHRPEPPSVASVMQADRDFAARAAAAGMQAAFVEYAAPDAVIFRAGVGPIRGSAAIGEAFAGTGNATLAWEPAAAEVAARKNSGLNLEHVFSQNWDHAKAHYYLLQLGHLLMQLLHHNSLHLALAKQYGRKTVLTLWGALKKIPQRLLEALRYYLLPKAFAAQAAQACHISLNTS